jgi:predicted site-specific integrase-resolvase
METPIKTNYDIQIDEHIDINKVMFILGVGRVSIYKYVKKGLIRTSGPDKRHTLYNSSDVYKLINYKKNDVRQDVAYIRVNKQSDKEHLQSQKKLICEFALKNGIIFSEIYSDIGASIHYSKVNRYGFNRMLSDVLTHKIKRIYVLSPDRISRFGFDLFKEICTKYECKIVCLKDKILSEPYNDEARREILSMLRFSKTWQEI